MKYNWQEKKWPKFKFDSEKIKENESTFLLNAGKFLGIVSHLNKKEKKQLQVEVLSTEGEKTSKIEGEILSRDSIQSSIKRHFKLQSDKKKATPQEQGIAELMVTLYQDYKRALTHKQLHEWNTLILSERTDVRTGKYRTHKEPMQIVSGPIYRPKIHFEAPPSEQVKKGMSQFINWFNQESKLFSPLIRASLTHIYFVSIHPFEDGNGRIARALSLKALSQSMEEPMLIMLSDTIESKKKRYYAALEDSNKTLEVTNWIAYFSEVILHAQKSTEDLIKFLVEKSQLYNQLKGQLNPRQEKVLNRIFKEGINGFKGGLSAEKYLRITKTSRATATRDLNDLLEKNVLTKTGALKHARYHLNIPS